MKVYHKLITSLISAIGFVLKYAWNAVLQIKSITLSSAGLLHGDGSDVSLCYFKWLSALSKANHDFKSLRPYSSLLYLKVMQFQLIGNFMMRKKNDNTVSNALRIWALMSKYTVINIKKISFHLVKGKNFWLQKSICDSNSITLHFQSSSMMLTEHTAKHFFSFF